MLNHIVQYAGEPSWLELSILFAILASLFVGMIAWAVHCWPPEEIEAPRADVLAFHARESEARRVLRMDGDLRRRADRVVGVRHGR